MGVTVTVPIIDSASDSVRGNDIDSNNASDTDNDNGSDYVRDSLSDSGSDRVWLHLNMYVFLFSVCVHERLGVCVHIVCFLHHPFRCRSVWRSSSWQHVPPSLVQLA